MSNFSIQKILDFPSNFPTSIANANAVMAAAMSAAAFASTAAGLQLPTAATPTAAAATLLPPQFPSPVDFYTQYNPFSSATAAAATGFPPFFSECTVNALLSADFAVNLNANPACQVRSGAR